MRALSSSFTGLVVAFASAQALAVDIGEKAPDLDVAEWVQGEPVVLEQCVGKGVVVLEFWGSWCEPCKKLIPRLNRVSEKYKAQGVEFAAISDEKLEDLKTFLKDGTVKYRVASDELRNTVAPYMKGVRAADHPPFSVVIDKTGAVVWKGAPNAGLERAIDKVLSGKLDVEKAKSIAEMQTVVEDSYDLKRWDQAAGDSDKLLETDPGNEKGLLSKLKSFATAKEPAKSKEFVEAILPRIDDDPVALNLVAWELITAENPAMRQPAAALKAATRSVALNESREAAFLDTLARVQSSIGLLDAAVETQTKAAAAEGADDGIKATLEYYKACVAARK